MSDTNPDMPHESRSLLRALLPREVWYLALSLGLALMTGIDWALMRDGDLPTGVMGFLGMLGILLALRLVYANNPKGFAVKRALFHTHVLAPRTLWVAVLALIALSLVPLVGAFQSLAQG